MFRLSLEDTWNRSFWHTPTTTFWWYLPQAKCQAFVELKKIEAVLFFVLCFCVVGGTWSCVVTVQGLPTAERERPLRNLSGSEHTGMPGNFLNVYNWMVESITNLCMRNLHCWFSGIGKLWAITTWDLHQIYLPTLAFSMILSMMPPCSQRPKRFSAQFSPQSSDTLNHYPKKIFQTNHVSQNGAAFDFWGWRSGIPTRMAIKCRQGFRNISDSAVGDSTEAYFFGCASFAQVATEVFQFIQKGKQFMG